MIAKILVVMDTCPRGVAVLVGAFFITSLCDSADGRRGEIRTPTDDAVLETAALPIELRACFCFRKTIVYSYLLVPARTCSYRGGSRW